MEIVHLAGNVLSGMSRAQGINSAAHWSRSRLGNQMWLWVFICLFGVEVYSLQCGHLNLQQLGLFILYPIILCGCLMLRARLLINIFFYATLLLAVVALLQPPYRGTHRWVTVGGWQFNISVLFLVAALLKASISQAKPALVILHTCTIALFLLSGSFSAAVLFISTRCLLAIESGRIGSRLLISWLSVFFLIGLTVLMTPNRVRRVSQFIHSNGYQTAQVRKILKSVEPFGISKQSELRLPSRINDFAWLDIVAKKGWLVGGLIFVQYGFAVLLLNRLGNATAGQAKEILRTSRTIILLAAAFHLLINLSVLPPMGVSPPFLGSGFSSDLAYKILLGISFGAAMQTITSLPQPGSEPCPTP